MLPDPPANVRVVDHPLVQHKLTILRRQDTPSALFRRLVHEIGLLLGYEATRDLALEMVEIATPLETMRAPMLAGRKLALVSILRAGNGLLEPMLELIPAARVGHLGMYRDPVTLQPVQYFAKLPGDLPERDVFVLDPMLATGNSTVAAIDWVKAAGALRITLVCLIAAPEGLARLHAAHPDVAVVTAAVDRQLDSHAYIRPGLGDAGDRLFGTR